MALNEIPFGGEIRSQPLNENFQYLEQKSDDIQQDLNTHKSNTVDPTSTDTIRNKHVSNNDIYKTQGSISSDVDTGIVSTPHNKQINVSINSRVSSIRGQINAAENGEVLENNSQINAGKDNVVSGPSSQINASTNSRVSSIRGQINAAENGEVSGNNSQINAGGDNVVSGHSAQINASTNCRSTATRAQINASQNVVNNSPSTVAGGYSPSGEPLLANRKWHIFSTTGDIQHSGVIQSGHVFSDFAELFPNLTGEAQGYGLLQTIDGYGVRPANEGEDVIGVTTGTAGIILGDAPFSWAERWLKDEWGVFIYEEIPDPDWEPNEGETEDDRPFISVPKENPEWNPNLPQVSRKDRPDEWSIVGLIGQVYVRVKEDVQPGDYVRAWKDGVGQSSLEKTNIRVMKITQDFDHNKGYAIAFCLLK